MLECDTKNRLNHKDAILEEYLASFTKKDMDAAGHIADRLYDPNHPLADTIIPIPVAAASEAPWLASAVKQYARSDTTTPFSIVLGLNIDSLKSSKREKGVRACRAMARQVIDAHPNLDIRSYFTEYVAPPIGEIRRDLWNGVLTARRKQGPFSPTKEIIGLNHDIDLVRLPKRYMRTVQAWMSDPTHAITPLYTQLKHAADPSHPNTSRLTFWHDYMNQARHDGYSAAAVIPMSYYAAHEGFDSGRTTHEVDTFIGTSRQRSLLRTGSLETSPRRMLSRLPYHGIDNVWSEDSFGPVDDCRDPKTLDQLPDITPALLHSRLQASVDSDLEKLLRLDHNRIAKVIKPENAGPHSVNWLADPNLERVMRTALHQAYDQRLRAIDLVLRLCLPDSSHLPIVNTERHLDFINRHAKSFAA